MSDYERGDRSKAAIAVQLDHTLGRLLRKDADREELWPLIYQYGGACSVDALDWVAALIARERRKLSA